MKKVFVCSPYRGDIEENTRLARMYCRYEMIMGNVPFAPHLLYTKFLDEDNPVDRERGIRAGLEIMKVCDELHVYGEKITEGMSMEIACWREMGRTEHRCTIIVCVKKHENI
jgi:hypothetical protein